MNDPKIFKAVVAGVGGGMVASWAVTRFYRLARRSSGSHPVFPYIAGAVIGAAYVAAIHGRDVPRLARVPLGAALWLAEPEKTAAPPKRGRSVGEKASNLGLRAASFSLKKLAQHALSA